MIHDHSVSCRGYLVSVALSREMAPDIYSGRQEMRNSPCGAWDVSPVLAQDSGVKMPPKLIQV